MGKKTPEFRDFCLLACFCVFRIHSRITSVACSLVSDGKIYDAYVVYPKNRESCLYSSDIFALKILPEVLERQCGYNLFIFGRDDLPGEGKLPEDKLHSSFFSLAAANTTQKSQSIRCDCKNQPPSNELFSYFLCWTMRNMALGASMKSVYLCLSPDIA